MFLSNLTFSVGVGGTSGRLKKLLLGGEVEKSTLSAGGAPRSNALAPLSSLVPCAGSHLVESLLHAGVQGGSLLVSNIGRGFWVIFAAFRVLGLLNSTFVGFPGDFEEGFPDFFGDSIFPLEGVSPDENFMTAGVSEPANS